MDNSQNNYCTVMKKCENDDGNITTIQIMTMKKTIMTIIRIFIKVTEKKKNENSDN